jgi:hypothetical protein
LKRFRRETVRGAWRPSSVSLGMTSSPRLFEMGCPRFSPGGAIVHPAHVHRKGG